MINTFNPTTWEQRNVGLCEFEADLVYTVNPQHPGYIVRPSLENKTERKRKRKRKLLQR